MIAGLTEPQDPASVSLCWLYIFSLHSKGRLLDLDDDEAGVKTDHQATNCTFTAIYMEYLEVWI